ncbi:nuclear transport factor 2 family protein [Micromonospora sp. NPDC048830]|uniref:nuclear transport factor 2 family protein n=1 Tax=Micromonospora sp. NPDC048830 TaxID=3364257 RepID=UPI003715B249
MTGSPSDATGAADLVQLRRTRDELDILKTLSRLARAQDDRDREAYVSCFTDTVLLTRSAVLEGWQPKEIPAAELADLYFAELKKYDAGQHMVFNHLIDIDGDEATCEADLHAVAVRTEDGRARTTFLAGRYDLRLRRVDGRWLIHQRAVTVRFQGEYEYPGPAVTA